MRKICHCILLLPAAALPWVAALAQQDAEEQAAAGNVEEVVILGSRRQQLRSATDAAVPIDLISAKDLLAQGSTDIIDVLISVNPSLNATREAISDAATLVRPVNLRALPADHTLVLVNGKRLHRSAVVSEFVTGVNRGAHPVDLNSLFGIALKQVEILRDGAAAQYGSDALAGVINYTLADNPDTRQVYAQFAQSVEGDGDAFEVGGSIGIPVATDGFVTLSFQIKKQDATSRGVQDGSGGGAGGAHQLAQAGFPVQNPVVVWGRPNVTDNLNFIFNSAFAVAGGELYAFGNLTSREVDGSFFYRNPAGRTGVFVDSDNNVLFADTTGDGGCPTPQPLPTESLAAAEAYIDNAPANCFAFFSRYPGGFTPRFGGTVEDQSLYLGFRGDASTQLQYDVSFSNGSNSLDYRINNTVNASLGPETPTRFSIGSQTQTETVINADFVYTLPVNSFFSDLNIAFGFQFWDEEFEIGAGERASYERGPYAEAGFSVGANGFQGFPDSNAGTFSRDSIALYADLEADITQKFLLTVASRFEDYSDFGTTFNVKTAARYRLADAVNLRGSFSTGFRAPTLGQSNLQRTSTGFVGGQLAEQLVISSTDPVAVFFGGGQLEPETAQNLNIGVAASLSDRVHLTVDYFSIEVSDRIAQIRSEITDENRAEVDRVRGTAIPRISAVNFFINDFDTSTTGLDLVLTYRISELTKVNWALHRNNTEVTDPGTVVSDVHIREIEDGLPGLRTTVSAEHRIDRLSGVLRFNWYDESVEDIFQSGMIVERSSIFIVDLEAGYDINDQLRITGGAKNLLDERPDEWRLANGDSGRTAGFQGAIYPPNHPAGIGGGSLYFRFSARF